ncbi:hypothetical protein D3C79_754590 [compost metagenome]
MPVNQFSRQHAVADQALWPVDVCQYGIEQPSALGDACSQLLPFASRQHMRQKIEFPGAISALGVGINVVGDAVFLQLPGQRSLALCQLRRTAALQIVAHRLPMATNLALGCKHFVVSTRLQRVGIKQVRHGSARRPQVNVRVALSDGADPE